MRWPELAGFFILPQRIQKGGNEMLKKIDGILKWFVLILGGGAVAYLFLLSIFGTSYATWRVFGEINGEPDGDGYNYCLPDNAWIHLLVLILIVAAAYLLIRYVRPQITVDTKWISLGIGLFYLAAGSWLILRSQFGPISDSAKLMHIAEQMVSGEYEAFQRDVGYLWRYPDQLGIVFLFYLLTLIFGRYQFIAFQFLNLLAAAAIGFVARKICCILWENAEWTGTAAQFLYYIFSPLLFYVTYLYGTVLGVSLSLAAIYFELLFLRKGRRFVHAAAAALLMGLAVLVKTNSMIMLAAMLIFLVYDLIMEKQRGKTVLAAALLLIVQIVFTQGLHAFMSNQSGVEISKGMPKLAWVAMALQESRLAPGTWNGHSVSLYEQAGYDYDEANRLAIESIEDSLERMWGDRSEAVRWFGRKMAFQWNEPFFGVAEMIRGRESDIQVSPLVSNLISGRLYYQLRIYLNYLQTIILAGCLLYFILTGSRQRRENFILLVVFLGGFLFHIAWEAKREYVLPYFLMLFPYAVRGFQVLVYRLGKALRGEYRINKKKIVRMVCMAALVLAIFAALYPTRLIQYSVAIKDEAEVRLPAEEELAEKTFGG